MFSCLSICLKRKQEYEKNSNYEKWELHRNHGKREMIGREGNKALAT
jgi:hypothetical protein